MMIPVKSHIRNGKKVKAYTRGKGTLVGGLTKKTATRVSGSPVIVGTPLKRRTTKSSVVSGFRKRLD